MLADRQVELAEEIAAGLHAMPLHISYTATKHAIAGLTSALRTEA